MALDLTVLLDEHGDYLLRVALRHFPVREVAEDLVQDTFLAAIEASARFEGHSSPRTWLTAILRHKIIDRIRRGNREQTPALEAAETLDSFFEKQGHWRQESAQPWAFNPELAARQAEFQRVLRGCLGSLTDMHRRVFLLREVSELETDEVCSVLDLSAANVRVILHRTRLALQRCIDQHWNGESFV